MVENEANKFYGNLIDPSIPSINMQDLINVRESYQKKNIYDDPHSDRRIGNLMIIGGDEILNAKRG